MKKLRIIVFTLGVLFALKGHTQDVIYTTSQEKIECRVIEVGLYEIKYQLETNTEGPIRAIPKSKVLRIEYKGGKAELYAANTDVPNIRTRYMRRAIKFKLFSPLFGNLGFGYEQLLKEGVNLDIGFGLIGLGTEYFDRGVNDQGFWLKAGPKFLFKEDFDVPGKRSNQLLQGGYIKPEVIFSTISYDIRENLWPPGATNPTVLTTDIRSSSVALTATMGHQWTADWLVIDMYVSLGYGKRFLQYELDPRSRYHDAESALDRDWFYSHWNLDSDQPIAFSTGFSLGFLIK